MHYLSGNGASAGEAIAVGCRFYAGYSITPSSEIMSGSKGFEGVGYPSGRNRQRPSKRLSGV